jgi:glycerophosphoryl diester phosphodiesterase family protein
MKINVQAHRGASAYAPENTAPSFKLAVEMGADGVENDIRLTKDGVYVLSHDSNINRMSNGKGEVNEMTYEELLQYDFGVRTNEKFKGTKITTLEEFLEIVKEMRVINIELKPFAPQEDKNYAFQYLYNALVQYNCVERTIISSFDHTALKELKAVHPDLKTALLYGHGMSPEETIAFVKSFNADIIHPQIGAINEKIVEACRKNGIEVNVWTVDSNHDIKRAMELGVTGIITNVPDKVLQTLRENGMHD